MFEIQTVVVAILGSGRAPSGLATARRLIAGSRGTRIHVVGVVPPASAEEIARWAPAACFAEDLELLTQNRESVLAGRLAAALSPSGVSREEIRTVTGPSDEALGAICADLGPDLLVLEVGEPNAETLNLVSEIAARVPTPMLLSRGKAYAPAPAIVVGMDLTEGCPTLLGWALSLASACGGSVLEVHALGDEEVRGAKAEENRQRRTREAGKVLAQIESTVEVPFPVMTHIRSLLRSPRIEPGAARDLLRAIPAEVGADLLVVGRSRDEGRGGLQLGEVARAAVDGAPCDVLLLPTA